MTVCEVEGGAGAPYLGVSAGTAAPIPESFVTMSEDHHSKILILGSGPAGYTAAIYTARANLEPMLISGMEEGGQMSITTDVENYPGFAEVIQGPWLMEQMKGQAEHVGTRLIGDLIVEVDLDERPFRCTGDSGAVYSGGLGCRARPSIAASAFRPAPPATASSTAARRSAWSAAAIPPSKRPSS